MTDKVMTEAGPASILERAEQLRIEAVREIEQANQRVKETRQDLTNREGELSAAVRAAVGLGIERKALARTLKVSESTIGAMVGKKPRAKKTTDVEATGG